MPMHRKQSIKIVIFSFFVGIGIFLYGISAKTIYHKVPEPFLWGVALCEYQNSGAANCPHSNWAAWEKKEGAIKGGQQSGKACDFWNSYPQDIELVKKIGLNSMRFSLEWSKIEPEPGVFDEAALAHYDAVFDAMIALNIEPLVTLHHFSHPIWFENKGGFECEANIIYFVRFCQKVFERFSAKVHRWCTINEPGVFAFQGYIRGVFPPGKTSSKLAGQVLINLLKAHVEVYKTLKTLPGGEQSEIGLAHQHMLFEPFHENSSLEANFCWYLSQLMSTAVLDFFATGKFSYKVIPIIDCFLGGFSLFPLSETLVYEDKSACKTLDFIGLNYYSHVLISWKAPWGPAYKEDDVVTDMPYAAYPSGLYNAIKDVSVLNIPIYITENGIADAQDNRRADFITSYLAALAQALQDGFDVRGYYYWTLMDNFEWDEGYRMKFGLFSVNYETQDRSLRDGAQALLKCVAKARSKIA